MSEKESLLRTTSHPVRKVPTAPLLLLVILTLTFTQSTHAYLSFQSGTTQRPRFCAGRTSHLSAASSSHSRQPSNDDYSVAVPRSARIGRRNGEVSPSLSTSQQKLDEHPKSHFFSQKSLSDSSFRFRQDSSAVDIFARLCAAAKIDRPSKIQSMAWPVLLKEQPQHAVIADQTGSGKTLAYLIPLLQRVILTARSGGTSTAATAATPRLLILAPTAELADQIRVVCQKLAADRNNDDDEDDKLLFSTVVLTASGKYATNIRDQIRLLQQRKSVDVLISTPGRIATILRTKHAAKRVLDLSQLQAVVLDEVDVLLLDETFGPQLQTIGEATTAAAAPAATVESKAAISVTQFVFVTATLPDTVVAQVQEQFPGTVLVKGPGLHRVAPTVQERLIDVSVPSAKNRDAAACFDVKSRALQQALRQNRCKRTLVFCNTVSACRKVENLLQRMDRKNQIYTVKAYHNAMASESRNENLDFFAKAGHGQNNGSGKSAVVDDTSYILVCTDRAARGVDFAAAAVDHVVIFDFPVDPAEYVRRVGRTARAGRDGVSTVLAYGWQLPIARSVMGQQQVWKDSSSSGGSVNERYDDDDEYMGGVKGRRLTKRQGSKGGNSNSSDNLIGGSIASGKLWNERGK